MRLEARVSVDGSATGGSTFLSSPGRRERVTHDAELADRVRGAIPDGKDVREVKMFGGLAFMVDERMVACVSGGGGALLVRVSRRRDAEYLEVAGARRAEMGKGRSMGEGWITVDEEALTEDRDLHFWIDAVLEYNAEKTARP
jgi:TfoX/Sxy family transcriptional regulator of competence genes